MDHQARVRWELENNVQSVDADSIFRVNEEEQKLIQQTKPWTKDPHYFKNVKISALALLKMVVHARSGGNIEIMGIMQGRISGDTFIVIDTFALPVEGTETRVNAQADAYEYMVAFSQTSKMVMDPNVERNLCIRLPPLQSSVSLLPTFRPTLFLHSCANPLSFPLCMSEFPLCPGWCQVGRLENVVGWYHSHPGYGCWLSGIDVSTQMSNQDFQEPFLAVVIDPTRTASAGKVEIGAFRTFPAGYRPPNELPSEYQTIPLNKIEDFGVHCKQYYSLDITYFKSSLDSHLLDLLWNKYWVNTLSSSPLLGNRDYVAGQISDLVDKLEQVESSFAHSGRVSGFLMPVYKKKDDESQLAKISKDSSNISIEQVHGIMSQVIKHILFNSVGLSKNDGNAKSSTSKNIIPMEF